jgi:formate hydrogenlyase subunit 3/multisubunit Na+/H+ antiporter MnhD subunit
MLWSDVMKEHLRLAWFASWFAFIGQVLVFLCVALFTGEWRYLLWSFLISMTAGLTGIVVTKNAAEKHEGKKER